MARVCRWVGMCELGVRRTWCGKLERWLFVLVRD